MNANKNRENLTERLGSLFWVGLLGCVFFVLLILFNGKTGSLKSQIVGVNPNIASVSELAQLPSLGPKKAAAIVDYRQKAASVKGRVFAEPRDLEKVSGIGEKTVKKIERWLEFD